MPPVAPRLLLLLAALSMFTSGCGAAVAGGLQAGQVSGGQAMVAEANERVAEATSRQVGRIPAATGDCTADTAAVTSVMASLPGRSVLGADEQVALARLAGLVEACGGAVDPQLQATFDAA